MERPYGAGGMRAGMQTTSDIGGPVRAIIYFENLTRPCSWNSTPPFFLISTLQYYIKRWVN